MTDSIRATRERFAAEVDGVREFIGDNAHNSGDIFTAIEYYRAASALRTLADTAQRIADAYAGGINDGR